MTRGLLALLLMLSTGGLLAACSPPAPPPHVQASGDVWTPDPGYAWIDSADPGKGVAWAADLNHPDFAHIRTAAEEGVWLPDEGYVLATPGSLTATWEPGQKNARFSHVSADETEGFWLADPGYAFQTKGALGQPVWTPGRRHPSASHIHAAATEQHWATDAGYRFQTDDISSAVWSPGTPHDRCPHVYAADTADNWRPGAGYQFVNTSPGDLTVAMIDTRTDGERAFSFFAKVIGAVVSHQASQAQEGDGFVTQTIGRPMARAASDALLESAADDLTGPAPTSC